MLDLSLDSYFLPLLLGFLLAVLVRGLFGGERFLVAQTVTGIHRNYVLISGCDSGFGRALALRLLNDGIHVMAGCFTEQVN
jgi:hypothetical protein